MSVELCWRNDIVAVDLLPIIHNHRDSEGKLIKE